MTIRNEDWKRITNEIQQAIKNQLSPHGWRKFVNWLRNWGIVGTNIMLIVALLAIALSAAYYAFSRVSKEAQFETNTTAHLEIIDTTLQKFTAAVTEIRLNQLSNTPSSQQSIKETQNVLRDARLNKVQLNKDTIVDAGIRFVNVTNTTPDAWATVQEFLNYRSYLNSVTIQLGPQIALREDLRTQYQVSKDNIPQPPIMRTIGASKAGDAAQLRTLSTPDLNKDLGVGVSLLVLEAPIVILDNLYAKNVAFENSHIIYSGGRAVLDNVYFLNSTFEIEGHAKGQELANKILSGAVTNFLPT